MNWRVVGAVVLAVLLVVGVVSVAGFLSDPFGWRKGRVERAEQAAETQTKQAELNGETVRIVDRTHYVTREIERRADDAAVQIADRSDGDAPLPAGLRDALLRDIGVLRGAEASGDPGSGDAEGRVPAAES